MDTRKNDGKFPTQAINIHGNTGNLFRPSQSHIDCLLLEIPGIFQ